MIPLISKVSERYFRKTSFAVIALGLLWVFITSINLFKAVHVDDGVHLAIAGHIASDPAHPYSGEVLFDNEVRPVHELNQPALYFYWLAFTGSIVSFDPVLLHLFQSLFVLACMILLYQIGLIISPETALLNTLLVAGSAAFIVNQNLLTDIPLLSTWLAFFYYLLKKGNKPERNHIMAGVFLGIALLVKYTSFPLLIIYAFVIITRFRWRKWGMIAIPLVFLAAWSVFNFFDYGGFHVLDRPVSGGFSISSLYMRLMSGIVTLGSICFFSPLVFALQIERDPSGWKYRILIGLTVLFILFVLVSALDILPHDRKSDFLRGTFIINGLLLLGLVLKNTAHYLSRFIKNPGEQTDAILWAWVILPFLFLVLQAPFQATRHSLLLIPPIVFLFVRKKHGALLKWPLRFSLALTLIFGMGMGVADWHYADFYRSAAREIMTKNSDVHKIWFTGDWGWQYYMDKEGAEQYLYEGDQPETGDLIYIPEVMRRPEIRESIQLVDHDTLLSPRAPLFNPAGVGSFYNSTYIYLPWHLNYRPFDTIFVYSVK